MRFLRDYQGTSFRLTDERLVHILEHPEMGGLEAFIEETLARPEYVVQSLSDSQVRLYYRFYEATRVSAKFLCVAVKADASNPFVVTAYLTDKVKKGDIVWPAKS
ncbi:MAG: hypothetical protein HY313_04080 [Acidobacteria bacterium]|nr:hypothetical protein [Acidobacteriota bacterium]